MSFAMSHEPCLTLTVTLETPFNVQGHIWAGLTFIRGVGGEVVCVLHIHQHLFCDNKTALITS